MPKRPTYYSADDTPHIRRIRTKYGRDCFRRWGRRGGNPLLLKVSERNRRLHNS